MSDLTDFFGEPIAVYTTTEAINDGVLVEAGPMAADLFRWSVLITRAAWTDCVEWTEEDGLRTGACQDQNGRLWDVLWMAFVGAKRAGATDQEQRFSLYRVPRHDVIREDGEIVPELVTLKFQISLHDDGSPLVLISQPEED